MFIPHKKIADHHSDYRWSSWRDPTEKYRCNMFFCSQKSIVCVYLWIKMNPSMLINLHQSTKGCYAIPNQWGKTSTCNLLLLSKPMMSLAIGPSSPSGQWKQLPQERRCGLHHLMRSSGSCVCEFLPESTGKGQAFGGSKTGKPRRCVHDIIYIYIYHYIYISLYIYIIIYLCSWKTHLSKTPFLRTPETAHM